MGFMLRDYVSNYEMDSSRKKKKEEEKRNGNVQRV
jgi:hypothetical protein